jgi:SAM-dependent methyltransferase
MVSYFDKRSKICPNCNSTSGEIIDRKYFFTALQRCSDCELMFRLPADNVRMNELFYNRDYQEGQTTSIPDEATLARMLEVGFDCEWNDYDSYIRKLQDLGIKQGSRVLDFGCSWGYGSYQLRKAGYDVLSYDIAQERRAFGVSRLGVTLIDEPDDIVEGHPLFESFDCFFSAHVLEHVPTPSKTIEFAWRCLKPGGVFVAFVPNGNMAYRKFSPESWRGMWGDVHPNFLDREFFNKQFAGEQPTFFARDDQELDQYYELGVAVRKTNEQASRPSTTKQL